MKIEQVISRQHIYSSAVGDFVLDVFYQSDRQFYIVVIQTSTKKRKHRLRMSTFEPVFGIDADDMSWILADAEAMCQEFEEENKNANRENPSLENK